MKMGYIEFCQLWNRCVREGKTLKEMAELAGCTDKSASQRAGYWRKKLGGDGVLKFQPELGRKAFDVEKLKQSLTENAA